MFFSSSFLCFSLQIADQKIKVQKFLEAIESIQTVKESLTLLSLATSYSNEEFPRFASSSSSSSTMLQRSITYRSALLVHNFASSSNESFQVEQMKRMELFACSEYERSSVALSAAFKNLSLLREETSSFSSSPSSSSSVLVDSQFPVSPNEVKQVNDETRKNAKILEEKMISFIENVFVNAVSVNASVDWKEASRHILRCFMHCVRGLNFLHCARSVEHCFVKTVVEPFVRFVLLFSTFCCSFRSFLFVLVQCQLNPWKN
jgi:hypothetical protein